MRGVMDKAQVRSVSTAARYAGEKIDARKKNYAARSYPGISGVLWRGSGERPRNGPAVRGANSCQVVCAGPGAGFALFQTLFVRWNYEDSFIGGNAAHGWHAALRQADVVHRDRLYGGRCRGRVQPVRLGRHRGHCPPVCPCLPEILQLAIGTYAFLLRKQTTQTRSVEAEQLLKNSS